jgi:hypothetical protein
VALSDPLVGAAAHKHGAVALGAATSEGVARRLRSGFLDGVWSYTGGGG